MWLVYGFLVTWVGGGIALLATLVMRSVYKPYPLALAAIAFGAAGFLCTGLGIGPRLVVALIALGTGGIGAFLGWLLVRTYRLSLSEVPIQPIVHSRTEPG